MRKFLRRQPVLTSWHTHSALLRLFLYHRQGKLPCRRICVPSAPQKPRRHFSHGQRHLPSSAETSSGGLAQGPCLSSQRGALISRPESATDCIREPAAATSAAGQERKILSHHKNLNSGHFLVDDRLTNGADKFDGKHIHFATPQFPDWKAVTDYLMTQLEDDNG